MKRLFLILGLLSVALWANARVTVLSSSPEELELRFTLDAYELQERNGFSSIRLNQAGYPEIIGAPSLPVLEFKTGVPPYGSATATLVSFTEETVRLKQRVQPVPLPQSGAGTSDYRYEIDEALYRDSPRDILQALDKQSFREHPYVPFVLNPFIYDGQYSLRVITSAIIKVQISGDTGTKSALRKDSMSDTLLQQMINTQDAQHWRETRRSSVNYADFAKSPWWAKIETDKPGMYRINYSQLSDFPRETIDPRSFRLFATTGKVLNQNTISPGDAFTEIPIRVVGEADGSFDSGDYIVFHGSDRTGYELNSVYQSTEQSIYHNPYSHNAVYWLSFAGQFDGQPLRISLDESVIAPNNTVQSHTEVVHIEEEIHRRDITGYSWYMTRMFGSSTMDYSFDVNLPDLEASNDQVLAMRFRQENSAAITTHRIQVLVNGSLLHSAEADSLIHSWGGSSVFIFSKNTSSFVAGSNRITIRAIRNGPDNFFLDYYRISYQRKLSKGNTQYRVNAFLPTLVQGVRYTFSGESTNTEVYKVSSHSQISMLPLQASGNGFYFTSTGGSSTKFYVSKAAELLQPAAVNVLEPTDLARIDGPVESIIIIPPEFAAKAEELAQMYRQNWGLNTKVVLQSDIFNQFNGGYPDPMAIRQYLRHVYHNFPEPKLKSLTLLGMGTIDWRNYSGVAANKNRVMIFQHYLNYIPADDYFGMLTSLSHPEIAIGRYPVSNLTELNTMMENFRRYTQSPKPGLWRNKTLLLADDNVNGNATADWQHTEDMQALSNMINPSVFNTKIFAADYDTDEFLNKPRVRDEMFAQVNEGKLIWYYIGHGAFDTLGMQNYLTGSTDMGRFNNPDMLPLFIAASCEVSSFDHWAYVSLGQRTVLLNNLGAIASVGATRKSFPDPNHELMSFFVPNMTNSRLPVGWALTDAKIRYTQSVNNDAMYVILGDPNLRIVPPAHSPTLFVSTPDSKASTTYYSRQTARFSGSYPEQGINGEATVIATDSEIRYLVGGYMVSQPGKQIFRGSVSVQNSDFDAAFLIPDDITGGQSGVVLSYFWDAATQQDYTSYYHPLTLSDEVLPGSPGNASPPEIEIFLGSYDFRPGDNVSTSPILYAKISDENGINVTGSAGHNILLVIDNSLQPIPVTDYFNYDTDSYTSGTMIYQLPQLSEGQHTIQLIAFDNFNLPAVASTHFIAKKSGPISLENLLIYPNPIKTSGHVTFIISENADFTLDIFSMSGRRLRRIEGLATQGFNKIPFDGRDEFGDALANNTYFIRIRAKTQDGKSIEKRERMVIYK
jgi:hypothetical protein